VDEEQTELELTPMTDTLSARSLERWWQAGLDSLTVDERP
jgi:hypothetical protein